MSPNGPPNTARIESSADPGKLGIEDQFETGTRVQFVEITQPAGIDWTPKNGEEAGYHAILESLGSGCAVADYDQDGRPDIFVAGGGSLAAGEKIAAVPMALYRQTDTWKFASKEVSAGLTSIRHFNHGNFTADYDEDGFPDLLITGYGGLQLFRNLGDGTFADVTDDAKLNETSWSSAAAWGDLNQDGALDLVVGHYVNWSFINHPACVHGASHQRIVCAPSSFQGLPCLVYLANGDGTFREASREIGINRIGKTLGIAVADLDNDGQLDVYVANDTTPNHLYKRQSSGNFKEVGLENGVALGEKGESDGSMGVDIADLDGDGRLDLWVANFENESFAFYRNQGIDLFTHASRAFGVTAAGAVAVGFGTVVVDVNGDGWEDIFCTNGHINAPDYPADRRQSPFLFLNENGKRFRNIAPLAGDYFRAKHLGRGVASADFDRNGTPDLLVTHTNEPIALLNNNTPIKNWVSMRLIGRQSPRSAIGARVVLTTGSRCQLKSVRGGGSYLSTSDLSLLFGLGEFTSIDSIEIRWPSGRIQQLANIHPHQHLDILESQE